MTNAVRGSQSVSGYQALHDFQLNAFEAQEHSEQVGSFRVVRKPARALDGKVYPSTDHGVGYVMRWLYWYRAT